MAFGTYVDFVNDELSKRITGGTFNYPSGQLNLANTTGGTFSISGIDIANVTGLTFNNSNYNLSIGKSNRCRSSNTK